MPAWFRARFRCNDFILYAYNTVSTNRKYTLLSSWNTLNTQFHCQNCWISYPRKSGKFPELPLFLNQEIFCWFPVQGKVETGTIGYSMGSLFKVSNRKTMCQNFLVGNLLKISLAFPLDFLAGKPKNAGSVPSFFNTKNSPNFKYWPKNPPLAVYSSWRSIYMLNNTRVF